ncbi:MULTISPECIES: alpha/beta fold hydrolase [unclassified Nocardioides]|uniref:alpha/beta fold hydrolase n=1 Tax=unclassified Nocardioides TaxID=2615069 RepID=UPI000A60B8B3|nr:MULTISPECIES: alpha/beta fold hydrolase [unclassified Nocardioides]
MTQSDVYLTEMGESGSRVVFFHGLFGQGKNWTQVAKSLAPDHRVTLVDMPNHGRSAWTEHLDYVEFADRLAELFSADDPVVLVGHSMGAKIAMVLALRHPELVERLAVVDMSPVDYANGSEFGVFIEGMQGMDLDSLERRSDADAALEVAAPSTTVRSFLLQNLRREGTGWRWQPNLELLGRELDVLGGWPEDRLGDVAPYEGRVLWVAGANSAYVTDEYADAMLRWFPRASRVTVKGAGHWVHSEQPEIFRQVLSRFVELA